MNESNLGVYLPEDRRRALAAGRDLPDRVTGAALFADISGFTPLTEALARDLGPKRGAEALTVQLNTIFDALIGEVNRFGGSVILFGGDAITCWFGDDDGRRATACGLAMQTAMQAFTSVALPSGASVSLAMKAAVAAGALRRFTVGAVDVQRIDVLAGATLDEMSETEHHAERGEVVLSPATAAKLAGKIEVREWRETVDGRFAVVERLRGAAPPAPGQARTARALTTAELKPWLLPPVFERLVAGQEMYLAEIRPTVALFLKFGGIDYDGDSAAGEKLDAYLSWAQQVLARHGGYLLQVLMGDKGSHFYATFGAPVAHDDDPVRAVAAALELCAPPAEAGAVHDIQIGLSRGRMWAGAYGGSARRTYGVLGDAVNLAARLMARAGAGQVFVSQSVVAAAGNEFEFEPVGLLQLKGKAEPQPVHRVVRRRAGISSVLARLAATPLIGRTAELARLHESLEKALAGAGQIMRVEGGAGLGKSHLTAHFATSAAHAGARLAFGICLSTTQISAYAPWRGLFRSLLGVTETMTTEQAVVQARAALEAAHPAWSVRLPLLGDLLDLPIPDNATTAAFDARLRQEALWALAVDLMQTLAEAQPQVWVIEDAHWMDEASLGLTLALGRALVRERVLLLLVQRPAAAEQPLLPALAELPHHAVVTLGELAPEEVAGLVAQRLAAPAAPLTLAIIQSQAQGHPFFVQELLTALREGGHIQPGKDGTWWVSETLFRALQANRCLVQDAEGVWQLDPNAPLAALALGLPDSVQAAVLARIDRLPESHKLTLKVASVLGRVFEFVVLAHMHPGRPAELLLREQAQLLEEREFAQQETPWPRLSYIFKHNITQEVVYETLLEAQQRELHRAAGTVLEGLAPEAVEALAYHFSRSGDREKTLIYLEKAAGKAQHEYANATALSYYEQLLALEERAAWRSGQIEMLHVLGQRDEERAALERLGALPNAPAYETARLWAQYFEAVSDYPQAQAAVERALAAAADDLRRATCFSQLGLIARRQGDYERAKGWYEQALARFPAADLSPEAAQALVQILNGLGVVHRQQGVFDEAKACYARALDLASAHDNKRGQAEAYNGLGAAEHYRRDFATAIQNYRQAVELRRLIGDRAGEGTSLFNLAMALKETGDYGQAGQYLLETLATQQMIGNRWEETNVLNGLGTLYQELGDLDQAQHYLEEGVRLSRAIGDEAGQAYLLANLGLVARDRGDLAQAGRVLEDGLAIARRQDDKYLVAYFLSYLGTVNLRAGRPQSAAKWAAQALQLRRENDLRLFTADDLATLAEAHLLLDAREVALDYARQSLAILDECGGEGPEFPQLDYFLCAFVLLNVGDAAGARAALGAAARLVQARAQKITDPVLRRSFMENVPINRQVLAEAQRLGALA